MTPLSFGDVITYSDRDYVFLGSSHEFVYLARVFHPSDPATKRIIELYERRSKGGKDQLLQNALFCYVILSTQEVRDHMAHLNQSQHDASVVFASAADVRCSLNGADKDELKQAIIQDNAPTSLELRRMFGQEI